MCRTLQPAHPGNTCTPSQLSHRTNTSCPFVLSFFFWSCFKSILAHCHFCLHKETHLGGSRRQGRVWGGGWMRAGGRSALRLQPSPHSALRPAWTNFPASERIRRCQMNAVAKLTDSRQVSASGMFLYFSNNDEFSNCVYVYLWASLCMCIYICIMYTNI